MLNGRWPHGLSTWNCVCDGIIIRDGSLTIPVYQTAPTGRTWLGVHQARGASNCQSGVCHLDKDQSLTVDSWSFVCSSRCTAALVVLLSVRMLEFSLTKKHNNMKLETYVSTLVCYFTRQKRNKWVNCWKDNILLQKCNLFSLLTSLQWKFCESSYRLMCSQP